MPLKTRKNYVSAIKHCAQGIPLKIQDGRRYHGNQLVQAIFSCRFS